MAQAIGKYAAKKMLSKQMEQYRGKDKSDDYDPYYQLIPKDPRKPNGKKKKVKKQIPDYIPEHDAIILSKMRQRAYWLDCSLFNLFGQRFGWSSVIGIVPAAGDAIDGGLAFLLYLRCTQLECGLGAANHIAMIVNIIIDLVIGFLPLLGDIFDAMFKANSRNVRILEKRLDEAYKPKEDRDFKKRNRKSMLDAYTPPGTVLQEFSDDEGDLAKLAQYDERGQPINGDGVQERYEPRRPEPARHSEEKRGGAPPERKPSRGWFSSSGSRRDRDPDLETGVDRHGSSRNDRR